MYNFKKIVRILSVNRAFLIYPKLFQGICVFIGENVLSYELYKRQTCKGLPLVFTADQGFSAFRGLRDPVRQELEIHILFKKIS